MIDIDHFNAVDMRVGRIVAVDEFPEARVPAWKLTIDFGEEVGLKRSSAPTGARRSDHVSPEPLRVRARRR